MDNDKKYKRFIVNFWARVSIQNDDLCWLWQGCKNRRGYGVVKYAKKTLIAHRIAYTLTYKSIPANMLVCHSCDTPACCNPKHLFLGTNLDNQRDMVLKNRQAHGEKHGGAKLTQADVNKIRYLYSTGSVTQQELSNKFNIARSKIGAIVKFESWKN